MLNDRANEKVQPPIADSLASRLLVFDAAGRLFWLKAVVAFAFCIGLVLSSRLWIGPRSYPFAPLIDGLVAPPFADTGLFVALFPLAALIALSARPRTFIAGFLAIVAVFCALDVTRWQPWVYQYGLVLATLGLFSWDRADTDGQRRTLNILRLIVASTYVFSGLQKVNADFVQVVFPELVEPIANVFPAAADPLYWVGVAAPLLQVAFGVGLLTRKFRRVSLIFAVSMHVFILAMIGPFGANWNTIVWPWTAAMAVFDLLLFGGKDAFSLREVLWTKRYPYHAAILALLGVMPCLSFVNLWDSYLSSALYSGNLTDAFIYVTDRGKDALSETMKAQLTQVAPDENELDVQQWATRELNVPAYPEARVHKRIAKSVCGRMADPTQLTLVIKEHRLWLSSPQTTYQCSDL